MAKKIKALIVCHDSSMSGANRSLYDWLESRDKKKLDVTVLIPKDKGPFRRLLESISCQVYVGHYNVPVKRLNKVSYLMHIKDGLKRLYAETLGQLAYFRIKQWIKKQHFDVIHSNSFAVDMGCALAMELHIPHIWHIREFMDDDYQISHLHPNRDKAYCAYSSAIFISPVIAEYYLSRYIFKRHTVIINRVNYDSSYIKKRQFMEDGICRILMAGVLSPQKGQRDAIEAVKSLRDEGWNVDLTLCGQGDSTFLNDLLTPSTVDYIHLEGYQPNILEYRAISDIALVCSRREALGRVTIEGMYYDNCVIGADAGCTRYILNDHQTGLLYDVGNSKQLGEKIKELINNPDLYYALIETAKHQAITKYSHDISNTITLFYEKCI